MKDKEMHTFYIVSLSASELIYEVRINDIPLYRSLDVSSVDVDLPVNQYVVTGENSISLHVFPLESGGYDAKANCEMSIGLRHGTNRNSKLTEVCSLSFKASYLEQNSGFAHVHPDPHYELIPERLEGGLAVGGSGAELNFDLETTFPRWLWFDATLLTDRESLKDELLEQYKIIHQTASLRDPRAVNSHFLEKIKDLKEAYYLSEDEALKRNEWGSHVVDSGLYLADISDEHVELRTYARGKLATLVYPDYSLPIAFVSNDDSYAHNMKLLYAYREGKGWGPIR